MKNIKLLFTAILTALLLASPVYAADIRLSSSCSLADAIIAANHDRPEGGCPAGRVVDTIILTQDITLRDELPKITSDIIIEGNGYAISGDHRWRIFYNDGGALTINDLTMTEGVVVGDLFTNTDESAKNATANPIGGAIVNWQGTLTVSGSNFSHNWADKDGGAISNYNGTLSIINNTFSHNSARVSSGAIGNVGGTLSIVSSTFGHNSGGLGGGAIGNGGELSIVNSTFSDNKAEGVGGAISNVGGTLSIVSSTFGHNSGGLGGAIVNWEGELSISGSTFSNNSAEVLGGAIYNAGELSMVNSSIAGSSGIACYSDSRLRHNINNFIQDGSCSPAWRD